MQLYTGTFVDTPSPGELRIQRNHLLAVSPQGFITHSLPVSSPEAQSLLSADPPGAATHLPTHTFLLPTFIDLHLHAPQYLYGGTGLDLPLMEWLERYTYPAEERVDADREVAERVYGTLAERLVRCGTGAVVLFGTLGVEANLILARKLLEKGLRGWVGKLSMDLCPRPSYNEFSPGQSLAALDTFLAAMSALTSPLPEHERLVHPIITPRFVPTCSDELLRGLAKVSEERGVRVQSHMCESGDQMRWVEETRGKRDERVWEDVGLLKEGTVMAHVTGMDAEVRSLCKEKGVVVGHCPLSNAYFSDKQFPLREAMDDDLSVGLGSDIAGGYALSIQQSMRQAVVTARLREGQRREKLQSGEEGEGGKSLRVDWVDSLYLASRGGKKAMGLGGAWEVGMEFDAQLIELCGDDGTSTGPLDIFDRPAKEEMDEQWWQEVIERWWCNGDDRNRTGMWVQGKKLM